MNGFALLWGKILESSIWVKESKETRLVWITMLAMKDSSGCIQASVIGLADRAKVSADECRTALQIFLSPDPDDTSKVDDGRRIREIHGGWQIVNHDLYRFSTEARREFWRQQKAEQRAHKPKRARKSGGLDGKPASAAYKAIEAREIRAQSEGILDENFLPVPPVGDYLKTPESPATPPNDFLPSGLTGVNLEDNALHPQRTDAKLPS